MKALTIIELILGIILIAMFMISWLVFKSIQLTDWCALIVGVLSIVMFAIATKRTKR